MPETDEGAPDNDLEDLFENAPCGYLSAHPDGRVTRANLTLASWLGCERQQLVGRRFPDLLNVAGKIYFETHFAPLLRMQGFFHEVALDLVGPDGRRVPVLANAAERRDERGTVSFIRIMLFNASDRRRYEQEILDAKRAMEQPNEKLRDLNQHLEMRVAEAVERHMQAEQALRQARMLSSILLSTRETQCQAAAD